MSIKSAKEFLERISKDEEFHKSCAALENVEQKDVFFKKNGFDFSKEEFEEVLSELNDSDLDGVAGGLAAPSKRDRWPWWHMKVLGA